RAADPPFAGAASRAAARPARGRPATPGDPARAAAPIRAASAPRARAGDDRADRVAATETSPQRARPRPSHRADPGPGGRPPGGRAAEAAPGHPGTGAEGAQTPRPR